MMNNTASAGTGTNGFDGGGSSELTNTLLAAMNADPQAEARLKQWKSSNYADYALALAVEIAAPGRPPHLRKMAAIQLKNMLNAKDRVFLEQNHKQWKAIPSAQRAQIKQALLQALASLEPEAAPSAALAASEIAAVELPFGEWDDFVPALMERVTTATANEVIPLTSLQVLGYTAERIAELEDKMNQPELSTAIVDKMLTTIVDGVQPNRSDNLRQAAIVALKNSLAFVRKNMEIKGERDFIMNAICEATRCNSALVRKEAFACMDQVADFYYDKLQDYMTVIFQLSTLAIQNDQDDSVQMAAIEFWSTVAFYEKELLEEEKDLVEQGRSLQASLSRPPCPKYTLSAMETLVPLLLETLSRQEEEEEDDDIWNLHAAGASCLESVSATVEELIVPIVMPFVELHISSDNWRLRDAAIVAFASILDGPATSFIATFVSQAIPVLLGAFQDPHVIVRDSATHCVAKICGLHILAVAPLEQQVHNIIQALLGKLSETPRIAARACFAIFNIAQSLRATQQEISDLPETNLLSAPMLSLLQALLAACDRKDSIECNLRMSSMSAAAELVQVSARDVQPILSDFLPAIIGRIESALTVQVMTADDNENKEQLLGLLCALVQSLFQRLEKRDVVHCGDRVMELLLQVLQARNSNCYEEALLAVGAVMGVMEEDFVKYLQHFMPALLVGLRTFQSQTLCIVSVGVVVDVCAAVGSQIQPYCDDIMTALREALQDASVSREVKPIVISCFGDIAMAIGAAYEPYLQVSSMMLMQASQQSAPPDDEDLLAFLNSLRLSILEAYSGIIFGLADGNALHLFVSNVTVILQFLQYLATPASNRDEDVLQKAVALIGDIAQQMGTLPQVRDQINQPFVAQLIQEASALEDQGARDIAMWTRGVVQQVVAVS